MINLDEKEAIKIAAELHAWYINPQTANELINGELKTKTLKFWEFVFQEDKKEHHYPWVKQLLKNLGLRKK